MKWQEQCQEFRKEVENDIGATVMGDASDLNIGGLGKPVMQEMEVFRIKIFAIPGSMTPSPSISSSSVRNRK